MKILAGDPKDYQHPVLSRGKSDRDGVLFQHQAEQWDIVGPGTTGTGGIFGGIFPENHPGVGFLCLVVTDTLAQLPPFRWWSHLRYGRRS